MKKIDRYILQKYFTTFFFCLILFTLVVVVVDMSEKTEDFARSGLSASQIFNQYYLAFIPHIDAMLFPLFVFISVIFFTSKMASRTEVVAILSSGVGFRRFLMPFAWGGFILAALLWFGYRELIPRSNEQWAYFEKVYINRNAAPTATRSTYKQNVYFRVDSNSYASIQGYDTISKTGTMLSIYRFANHQLTYNLRALNFRWDTAQKKWELSNVLERDLLPIKENVSYSYRKTVNYPFRPIDLRKDDYLKDQMSSRELKEFIDKEKQRGSEMLGMLEVEWHNRNAIPVSVFILTLIGAILASRKVRGGSGIHLAIGVIISVTYILCSRFTIVFATRGSMSPSWAAWTPNILFGLLTLYLYRRAPK
jgi:lipopolysaccharide export system permease protein